MPTTTTQDGAVRRSIQYRVSDIDDAGDAIDIHGFESKGDALTYAKGLLASGSVAVVVERHTQYWPAFRVEEADIYATVACMGNTEALAAGGWR